MRDLTHGREEAIKAQCISRQRLSAMLLRHGHRYSGETTWTQAHMRWLADINMPHPEQQIILQEYIHAVMECTERVAGLTEQIQKIIPACRTAPVIRAIKALSRIVRKISTTRNSIFHFAYKPGSSIRSNRNEKCRYRQYPCYHKWFPSLTSRPSI